MTHRYPLEPLLKATGRTKTGLARNLGLSGGSITEASTNGLSEKLADRWAVRSGLDPYCVWPEMVDHLVAEAMRTCAADECEETFTPYHGKHIYCSRGCTRRQGARNLRASRPGSAAAKTRTWRAENLERHRAYNREYQREYMRRLRRRKPSAESEAA
jgi:hypothetical protein